MSFRDGTLWWALRAGKTTMLNIMSGLVAPSQRLGEFDSVDMTAASPQPAQHSDVSVW
jgi:ABC-type multidrug transport system ATPase subunit